MVPGRKEVVVEQYMVLLRGWPEQGAAERLGFETRLLLVEEKEQ